MKKLLILLALVMAVYYSTVKADVGKIETWRECAERVATLDAKRSHEDQSGWLNDVCYFYDKPMPECMAILQSSTQAELNQIISTYVLHAVIIPQCGTTNENK